MDVMNKNTQISEGSIVPTQWFLHRRQAGNPIIIPTSAAVRAVPEATLESTLSRQ